MAQKREVRAFQDRGTWRFRTQDIEELARRRGVASNPDLQLGEAPRPKPHDSPAPRTPAKGGDEGGVFNFALGDSSDEVEIGQDILLPRAGDSKKTSGKSSRRDLAAKGSPKPGSDSDVRLVAEGSDITFKVASDSDIKVVDSPVPAPKSDVRRQGKKPGDSGVRLVPDSDSDVKIVPDSHEHDVLPGGEPPLKTQSDSDIRIEPTAGPSSGVRLGERSPEDSVLTEEIDLDAELRKAELEAKSKQPGEKPRPRGKPTQMAPASPFELSDSDLETPQQSTEITAKKKPARPDSSDFELAPSKEKPDSSDFELNIKDDGSPLEVASDDSVEIGLKEEEVELGTTPKREGAAGPDSGINLEQPADSGISLEQEGSSDEIEFELSLDPAESTPQPARAAAQNVDSDSEFELTLDDSGGLAPLEEEGGTASATGEEQDIFETDFEVPALEEESGSEAVVLDGSDTDMGSSDFDLAIGDEDIQTEEDSGSQVVVLEDEEGVDDSAATVARQAPPGGDDETEEGEVEAVDEELPEEMEAEEEPATPVRRGPAVVAAQPAWGFLPALVMLPCVIVMFLVGIMGFELLHGMWGYRQPYKVSGPVVRGISEMFVSDLPKD